MKQLTTGKKATADGRNILEDAATICPISQGAAYPRIAAVPINPCVGEARAQHNCRPATLRQLTMYRLCSPAIESGGDFRPGNCCDFRIAGLAEVVEVVRCKGKGDHHARLLSGLDGCHCRDRC